MLLSVAKTQWPSVLSDCSLHVDTSISCCKQDNSFKDSFVLCKEDMNQPWAWFDAETGIGGIYQWGSRVEVLTAIIVDK